MMDPVAIIIPHYKGELYIDECVSSIRHSLRDDSVIIIVNNQDTLLKNRWEDNRINIINIHKPVGFARAVNAGLYYAISREFRKYVVINQDSKFVGNGLELLLRVVNKNENKIYSPLILSRVDGPVHPSFSERLETNRERAVKQSPRITFLPATCWAFTKSTFNLMGYFDPLFFHYGEDRDIANRANMEFQVVRESKLVHANEKKDVGKEAQVELLLSIGRARYNTRYGSLTKVLLYCVKRSWILLRVYKRPGLVISFIKRVGKMLIYERPFLSSRDFDQIQQRALQYIIEDLENYINQR